MGDFEPMTHFRFELAETEGGTVTRRGLLDIRISEHKEIGFGPSNADEQPTLFAVVNLEVGDYKYAHRIDLSRGGLFEQLIAGALMDGIDPALIPLISTPFVFLNPAFEGPFRIQSGSYYLGGKLVSITSRMQGNTRVTILRRNMDVVLEVWTQPDFPLPIRTRWHGGGVIREAILADQGGDDTE